MGLLDGFKKNKIKKNVLKEYNTIVELYSKVQEFKKNKRYDSEQDQIKLNEDIVKNNLSDLGMVMDTIDDNEYKIDKDYRFLDVRGSKTKIIDKNELHQRKKYSLDYSRNLDYANEISYDCELDNIKYKWNEYKGTDDKHVNIKIILLKALHVRIFKEIQKFRNKEILTYYIYEGFDNGGFKEFKGNVDNDFINRAVYYLKIVDVVENMDIDYSLEKEGIFLHELSHLSEVEFKKTYSSFYKFLLDIDQTKFNFLTSCDYDRKTNKRLHNYLLENSTIENKLEKEKDMKKKSETVMEHHERVMGGTGSMGPI